MITAMVQLSRFHRVKVKQDGVRSCRCPPKDDMAGKACRLLIAWIPSSLTSYVFPEGRDLLSRINNIAVQKPGVARLGSQERKSALGKGKMFS